MKISVYGAVAIDKKSEFIYNYMIELLYYYYL